MSMCYKSNSPDFSLPLHLWTIFALICALGTNPISAQPQSKRLAAVDQPGQTSPVVLIKINGVIGPATKDFFERAHAKAQTQNAAIFIVQLNTPGGLDSSMRDINAVILASKIPVVIYVAPQGARAASAGTYMLYASHVAAMAPATNLGAATPIQMGMQPQSQDKNRNAEKNTAEDGGNSSTLANKAVNDAAAYIRGLALLRKRNVQWAEQAVRHAKSLSATEALEQNVIDILAKDLNDLLRQLNGRSIKLQHAETVLNTDSVSILTIEPDWRTQLLTIITNPNIAYLLMLIGIYGLIFEFSNPGFFAPGTIGAVCLLLAMFGFQTLPINYAGLALIILGLIFMVAEAFVPSFGSLGITGVIAFVVGSIILMDTDVPGMGVSLPLIGGFAFFSSALFTVIMVMALKSRQRPVVSGQENIIGAEAEAVENFDREGHAHLQGENWQVISSAPVTQGQKLKVVKLDGLILHVEPVSMPIKHNEEPST